MKVIAGIEAEEVIGRSLSHLPLRSLGGGARAPPKAARCGPAARATRGPSELGYEPGHDDLPWPDSA